MKRLSKILPIMLLVLAVMACDAWVEVDGIVTDETGGPIANANVVITQGDRTVGEHLTDEKGTFRAFDNIAPFPFSFTANLRCKIVKQGYETTELTINGNERRTRDNPLRIVLKK